MILAAFVLVAAAALAAIALGRTHRQMNSACIAEAAIFLCISAWLILSGQIPMTLLTVGNEFFFIDHLGIYEVLIATVIFLLAAVYARGYVENLIEARELSRGSLKLFYGSWAFLLLVIVLAFFSDNLALFWIFTELTTVISAMLVAILYARDNIDAAIKYIFIASVSMLFSFVGLIFLFEISRSVVGTGTLNWTVLMQQAGSFPPGMVIAAFALIFIGFAAKSGIFPFHTWLPEAHVRAPSAVSAILSGVLLNVGIYGIIRVFAIVHQTTAVSTVSLLLLIFGLLTVFIAALSMLPQKKLKKLIAFSSIENMGILLIGLAVATPLAIFWVLFHVMAHAFTKAGLFFSAGILHRQYHSTLSPDAVDDMRDVFALQPVAAWGIVLGGLAITGMPLFPVFLSKFFLLVQLAGFSPVALVILLVLLFIAAGAFGYFVLRTFTQVSGPGAHAEIVRYQTPAGMNLPVIVLLVLTLILGTVITSGEVAFLDQVVAELMF
ncbi:proton-conducting transporter transmembrane domain-containing protein [Methanoregula formicica]|uniref:Formate hydrogenlyase subunit 3/multisubunit Na+/H+ antiporter, MnhD subunit n=1 Tax=Methanoregula formicica (strain DSM 22288 / NBRC 105244 / SMSP) TaxID=593750 RepID=L0HJ52_METFS|nr:proton-conducting transporter membrane subunit [Methanoregula formicica]AGB03109.1 formate hydrogenlyase subunit 3/multisubunit Na+/H+ antiporter, MnhD subunit [Methanoregula formicica SMSP]